VDTTKETRGILCSKSYVTIHATANNMALLEAIWLIFNSRFAVYYLFLTSSTPSRKSCPRFWH